eukprot:UN10538
MMRPKNYVNENNTLDESLDSLVGKAYKKMLDSFIEGSCTIVLARINYKNRTLESYVLGDSMIKVARVLDDGKYHFSFESSELEHHFGCPKQLGSHNASSEV